MMPKVVPSTSGTLVILLISLLLVIPLCLIMAQDNLLYHMCLDTANYTVGSQFESNLDSLLIQSSYNNPRTEGNEPDQVFGLFLCRNDVELSVCQICIEKAKVEIVKQFPLRKDAIIWYDECSIRYSNRSFFSVKETHPRFFIWNTANITEEPDKFNEILANMFLNLSEVATSNPSNRMYATTEVNVCSFSTLYGRVQCTPYLSAEDCSSCLSDAVAEMRTLFPGKKGGRIFTPSCNLMYELNLAANSTDNGSSGRRGKIIAISVSLSGFLVVTLLGSCIYYQRKRKRTDKEEEENGQELQLIDLAGGRLDNYYNSENLQGETHEKSQDFPLIHLDFIREATKQFSEENKLGEGGFSPVYKGTLPDGKEVAVKRLSRNSGQGLQEFKNEVTLIARLQHRNLVRLLGCCLEGQELLLIYEYMPNKSLDVFLFDSTKGVQLDWKVRLLIINGIARGLLYLHEDSRLRIIHRDLKASNVLLDHEMNPKISDFGMAKIFGGNQSEANTNRVVRTYGYMAPKYAMEGLFSVKSDVFSFRVLLLEIISGKKNSGFHLSEHGHSLLTFAWKLWSEGQGLELVDPLLVQSCVPVEVLKCIHIGLLCVQEDPADRPTMSFVVVTLGSDAVTLPQPTQPAFSVGRQVLKSVQSSPNIQGLSVNEVTISDVSPR